MNLPLDERILVCETEMAAWVPGVDAAPLHDVDGGPPGEASTRLVLVRLHGHPLGYVTVPICDASVSKAAILDALVDRHLNAIGSSLARASLDGQPVPATRPLVTVAVCTRDRPVELDRCLAALRRLRYPALDLLVVDNAPTDSRTAAVVRRHPGVRYAVEPRPGLDWARNRAIADCRGDILAFTDDDVVVDAGWVDALVNVFECDPAVMGVTGLVLPLELHARPQRLFETYGGFARGVSRRWCRARPGRPAALEFGGTGALGTGANMAFRRRVFDVIGGFDPALDVGTPANGGGDLEMFFRVLKHGHTLVYEPSALVWHRHRQEAKALRTQIVNNGIGFYAYLARTWSACPDERLSVLRLGLWWFGWWSIRRLANRLRGREPVPLDLIMGELAGSLLGPFQYLRARRRAAATARAYPGARTVGVEPATAPPARVLTREAVRHVDIAEPLAPLRGLAEVRRVRLFVFRDGELLGSALIDNRGADVSVLQLRDAIAQHLPIEVIEGPRPDTDRGWRRLATAWRAAWLPDAGMAAAASPLAASEGDAAPLSPDVRVSVVLATYDRPDDLRACLASIAGQHTSSRPIEVIVVDNHPASGLTPPVVQEFPGVRLVSEPRAGLSYARNRGILASAGDIILTTDDDVVCPPDWVERMVAPFGRPEVMIVTGNVLPLELETAAQQFFETYGGLGRGFRAWSAGPAMFAAYRRSVPTWRLGCTASAAFRAAIFANPRIGLMDEALGAGTPTGCSEDTYIFYRVLAAGGTIAYEPRAYVWHRHRRTLGALERQIYSYSKGHVAYHLTTWLVDGDRRGLVRLVYELPVTYAQRTLQRLIRRSDYPLRLIALEVLGTLAGPWALWRSRRRVRRLGPSGQRPAPPVATAPAET